MNKDNLWTVRNLNTQRLEDNESVLDDKERKQIWDLLKMIENNQINPEDMLSHLSKLSTKALLVFNEMVKEKRHLLNLLPLRWQRVENGTSPLPGNAISFKPLVGNQLQYFCRVTHDGHPSEFLTSNGTSDQERQWPGFPGLRIF